DRWRTLTRTSPPRGFSFRPKICTNCPETVASGNAGAEAIGSSRLANTALRTLVVPELKLFRPHRAPKITQLSCRRRCDRRTAFWRRARRSPSDHQFLVGRRADRSRCADVARARRLFCPRLANGSRGGGPCSQRTYRQLPSRHATPRRFP